MLVLDTTFFQGVCWHLGSGRAWMPVGLLGSLAGRPLSKWDGVGTARWGWNHSSSARVSAKPQAAPGWSSHDWGGDAATSCPTSALPLTLLFPGIYPCALDAGVSGQGRYRTPPSIPTWGEPASTPAWRRHNAEPPLPPRPSAQCLRERL